MMTQFKKITIDRSLVNYFDDLKKIFNKNLILLRSSDEQGKILAVFLGVIVGKRARLLLAASGPEGRKAYASYPLFWHFLEICHDQKISMYDMGGVDPKNNPGVYFFKKGMGAKEVKYLGEWELTNFQPLRWAMNFLIKWRGVKS